MKSKISFFNFTILKKNILLYWPVWTSYFLILFLMIPCRLLACWAGNPKESKLEIVTQVLDLPLGIALVFVFSVIVGMVLFSYLNVAKVANMMHALPVTRGELFRTNVFSGLLILLVPEFLVFLVSVLICLNCGITNVEYLGLWFVCMAGVGFFFYGIVVFCEMLTGLTWGLPFFVFIVNFVYLFGVEMVDALVQYLGYGLEFEEIPTLDCLSPAYCLISKVYFVGHYEYDSVLKNLVCTGVELQGMKYVAVYAAVSILFYIGAYVLYRKRPLECVGDLVAVNFLRPVFRWGSGIVLGYLLAVVFLDIMISSASFLPKWGVVLAVLISAEGFFWAAQMLLEKNFRVLKKRMLVENGMFVIVMMMSLTGVKYATNQMVSFIPDAEDISYGVMYDSYETRYEEDIAELLSLHKMILAKADEFYQDSYQEDMCEYLQISYYLKDGTEVIRNYAIPYTEDGINVCRKIAQCEMEPGRYIKQLFGELQPDFNQFRSGELEIYEEDYTYTRNILINREYAGQIARAIYEDCKSGAIQKYNCYAYENLMQQLEPDDEDERIPYIFMENENNLVENTTSFDEIISSFSFSDTYEEYEDSYSMMYIRIGPECENTIEALQNCGLINSQQELFSQRLL